MRTKGRSRKVVKAIAAPPDERRKGYKSYCDWTLHLSCGHTTVRRSTTYATWSYTECPVADCQGPQKNLDASIDFSENP